MGFTRAGATWKKSGLGAKLSCVAVCQVIKHPAVKLPGGETEHDLDRSSTVGGDRVPSTYGQKKKRIGNSASPLPPPKKNARNTTPLKFSQPEGHSAFVMVAGVRYGHQCALGSVAS